MFQMLANKDKMVVINSSADKSVTVTILIMRSALWFMEE